MAEQEIKGDLWDQSLELDLPPLSTRALFHNMFPHLCAKFVGNRDPRLTKLTLDQASRSCQLTHVSKRMFYMRSD
jgi:hypothetical protein